MRTVLTMKSIVDCSHLSIQPDGGEVTIGDVHIKEFIRVPFIASDFVKQLDGTRSVEEAGRNIEETHKQSIDALDFVETLLELNLVLSIDGKILNPEIKRNSSTTLKKIGNILFSKQFIVFYIFTILSSIILLLVNPDLFPVVTDLFIFEPIGLSTLNLILISWLLVLVHEFGHLLAASKENINSNIRLNLRFVMLVAETDMTGLWSKPRKRRYMPYLAGIAWDAVLLCLSLSLQLVVTEVMVVNYLKIIAYFSLFSIIWQFLIVFRTDMYFVLINILGTSNLHRHGILYLKKFFLKQDILDWSDLNYNEKKNSKWFGWMYLAAIIITIPVIIYFQIIPFLHILNKVMVSLSESGENYLLFWDSCIFISLAIINGVIWFLGFRNARKDQNELQTNL